jgi:uncharacterized DUF497 family protein
MPFGFDLTKSKLNKEKHGIDFHEAQRLWEDSNFSVRRTRKEEIALNEI